MERGNDVLFTQYNVIIVCLTGPLDCLVMEFKSRVKIL